MRCKKNVVRFWHWKEPIAFTKLGVSDPVSERTSIDQLPTSETVTLIQIDFPPLESYAKQRRIRNKKFNKCLFSQKIIEDITFTNCTFEECSFNGATIAEAEFHSCIFTNCSFYKTKFRSTYIDPRSFTFSDDWHWDRANVNSGLYQALYRNSKEIHQENFAMYADKKFQFYRRYQDLRGRDKNLLKFLLSMLYDYLLGYGYGIINTLTGTIVIICTFALIIDGNLIKNGNTFWEALYFSIVSFTTVGYGELTPNHTFWPLACTAAFLLVSVAWCAVVTAIIVKRIVK